MYPKIQKDELLMGRFTIYCYDIINKEYITEVNTPALAIRLNISIDSRAIKRIICKSQYIY